MERPITLWVADYEHGQICKASLKSLAAWSRYPEEYVTHVVTNREDLQCISTTSKEFKDYGCESWSDKAIEGRFVETLINKCQKWAP